MPACSVFSQMPRILRKYSIPMVNYQRALGMDVVPDYSPYYSESTLHRHPRWPTHVLWAQLMTEVILRSVIAQGDSLSRDSGTPPMSISPQDRTHDSYRDGLETTFGLCMAVSAA